MMVGVDGSAMDGGFGSTVDSHASDDSSNFLDTAVMANKPAHSITVFIVRCCQRYAVRSDVSVSPVVKVTCHKDQSCPRHSSEELLLLLRDARLHEHVDALEAS